MTAPARPTRPETSRGATARATDVALVAGFAALIAVCALLPALRLAGPVPITLQTFAVLLSGAVLGPRRGALAVALYVVVGLAGLPVFSGGAAGVGVLAGPSAGYLLGFVPAAFCCGLLVSRMPPRWRRRGPVWVLAAGLLSSALFIHTLGMAGLVLRAGLGWGEAFLADLVFWPGDVIKNVAMALVTTAVHRAFPDLLPARRRRPA